ncbi:MAG: FtsQ-type POTRA domain-containing protein [Anaerolineales bacterium]|nr:FtsQ-type POTRA domain-containing protein [Anaerolineales bacterium]
MSISSRVLGGGKPRARRVRAQRARMAFATDAVLPEPRRRPAQRRARKRYEVSVPNRLGAGVQLPSVPVVRPGPRLLSALMLALVVLGGSRLVGAPQFMVGEAEVNQTLMLPDQLIRSLIGVDRRSIFLADPQAIRARLELQPEISRAEVSVKWPNRVVVGIQERHPILEWNDAGRVWWVSSEGIGYLAHGSWPGLIKVSSRKPMLTISPDPLAPVVAPEILRAAGVLSAQLPAEVGLIYNQDRGLGFEDSRGWKAYFGLDGDLVLKYRLHERIAEALQAQGIQPAMVSVEDLGAPYYEESR